MYGLVLALLAVPATRFATTSWSVGWATIKVSGSNVGGTMTYSGSLPSPLWAIVGLALLELWRYAGVISRSWAIGTNAVVFTEGVFSTRVRVVQRRPGETAHVRRGRVLLEFPQTAGLPAARLELTGLESPALAAEIFTESAPPAARPASRHPRGTPGFTEP